MAFSIALFNSAHRHFLAATQLDGAEKAHLRRVDIAGYLYGVAAECALKQIMLDAGMRPLPREERRDDPFYAHFPELKTLLRDLAEGRGFQELERYARDDALMSDWDVAMRYAPGKEILPRFVERWRKQAKSLVDAMEGA